MPAFFEVLGQRPAALSRLSRYTVANGALYVGLGLGMMVGAGPLATVVAAVEGFVIHDVGMVRVVGLTLAIIGWFYVIGGRTGAPAFGLATVADRVLVPFVLVPLWAVGELPGSVSLPFAVLDPALALGAFLVWRAEAASGEG